MLTDINFTDPQGLSHTGAVFVVRQGDRNQNTSASVRLDTTDWQTLETTDTLSPSHLSYQVYYWTTAAAKSNGSMPYILANPDQVGMDFYFELTAAYDSLTVEAQVEKHLTDIVLPPMLTA
jgi:hypothetical protein